MCDLNQLNSARERLVNPSAASALLLSDAHAQRDCSSRSHLFTEFIEFATRKDIMPIDFNRAWAGERGADTQCDMGFIGLDGSESLFPCIPCSLFGSEAHSDNNRSSPDFSHFPTTYIFTYDRGQSIMSST